jgi:hypothetical protein
VAEFARKADELRRQQDELVEAREGVEQQIKQRVQAERSQVAAAEAKKAREQVAGDLEVVKQQLAESDRTFGSAQRQACRGPTGARANVADAT